MIATKIEIRGIESLRGKFQKSPEITKKWLNKAISKSLFDILKRTDDSGDSKLFQFKLPRSLRTGYLAQSFKFGMFTSDLTGSIGPTANYAKDVHDTNKYLPRIAEASTSDVVKNFEDAAVEITNEIVK